MIPCYLPIPCPRANQQASRYALLSCGGATHGQDTTLSGLLATHWGQRQVSPLTPFFFLLSHFPSLCESYHIFYVPQSPSFYLHQCVTRATQSRDPFAKSLMTKGIVKTQPRVKNPEQHKNTINQKQTMQSIQEYSMNTAIHTKNSMRIISGRQEARNTIRQRVIHRSQSRNPFT